MHASLDPSIFNPAKLERAHRPDERGVARGKAARKSTPRSRNAELELAGRPDPVALLEEQGRARIQELLPIRYGRMIASPFAFLRGAALVMASDLSRTPTSGIRTQLCGDAHLVNFGMFGTPGRRLVFDVNDFDETLPGPWEWDIKRLAASLEVAGRSNGYTKHQRHDIVVDAARSYQDTMSDLAGEGNLDVWYTRLDVEAAVERFARSGSHKEVNVAEKAVAKAFRHDRFESLAKLTEIVDGKRQMVSSPPLIVPMRMLVNKRGDEYRAALKELLDGYAASLSFDRRVLLEQYRFIELARKVVGVGSVGTRCWVALYMGADAEDPLFLQIKEAEASVLERFLSPSEYSHHGERVVSGQRLMQATSDILLGWGRATIDGISRHFYIRQLRDWKGSFVVDTMKPRGMSLYGRMCAWTLARAHARAGDRAAIAGYLGTSDRFAEALATFSVAYADQTEADHAALVRAVQAGRIHAETLSTPDGA